MAVHYKPIDGEQVSAAWLSVLKAMRADGVWFNVNEGHRTMARQQYFWDLYQSGRGNLAAYPSPYAPHIRTGRLDHAIDFSNDAAVFSWLSRHGLRPVRTVAGESWHIECPASALVAFYNNHQPKPSILRFLGPLRKKASKTLLARRRARIAEARTGRGPKWRALDAAVQRSYDKVRGYWKRAHGRQARVLKRVLKDRNGRV